MHVLVSFQTWKDLSVLPTENSWKHALVKYGHVSRHDLQVYLGGLVAVSFKKNAPVARIFETVSSMS